jgi:hypothetical protein
VKIAYIKAIASSLGFSSVLEKKGNVIFNLSNAKNIDFQAISLAAEKYRRQLLFNAGLTPYIVFKPDTEQKNNILGQY